MNLLFYGSFLPIPSKDIFKSKNSEEEFVLIDHNQKTIESENYYNYPGKIIPYESANNNKDNLQPANNATASASNTINEEGELKDDEENSQDNNNNNNKMQTDSISLQLTDEIYLNKEKSSTDCVLLTVFNSSNQTIKVII